MRIFSYFLLTLWLHVDILWVLFLATFSHAKSSLIGINIVEHVCVLITTEPLIFPIEP